MPRWNLVEVEKFQSVNSLLGSVGLTVVFIVSELELKIYEPVLFMKPRCDFLVQLIIQEVFLCFDSPWKGQKPAVWFLLEPDEINITFFCWETPNDFQTEFSLVSDGKNGSL